jgi:hypothetical protein
VAIDKEIALGFRVKSGFAIAVALSGTVAAPTVLARRIVQLSDPDVEASRQPYHNGFGTAPDQAGEPGDLLRILGALVLVASSRRRAMGKINAGRVILGGLLAGLVINIGETLLNAVVLASDMEAVTAARNVPPVGGSAIAGFVIMCFALGIGAVWFYAAIRPRFGAGAKTAAIAGVTVWLLSFTWGIVGDALMQFLPGRIVLIGLVWSFCEVMLASIAGAWLYRE